MEIFDVVRIDVCQLSSDGVIHKNNHYCPVNDLNSYLK